MATLFSVWVDAPDRAGWDVDLLGTDNPTPALMEALFRKSVNSKWTATTA